MGCIADGRGEDLHPLGQRLSKSSPYLTHHTGGHRIGSPRSHVGSISQEWKSRLTATLLYPYLLPVRLWEAERRRKNSLGGRAESERARRVPVTLAEIDAGRGYSSHGDWPQTTRTCPEPGTGLALGVGQHSPTGL